MSTEPRVRPEVVIRRAAEGDAEAIIAIIGEIAGERIHSAIDTPWSVEEQRRYIRSLSGREVIHVAETEQGAVAGYQVLELWARTIRSMAHVGQLGTYLRPEWRRMGVGEALFRETVAFARGRDYAKFVIQVRASNGGAQSFYARLGFRECGRLSRQVRIDGQEDDEVLMECFP